MKTALILGGNRFFGRHLCLRLLDEGYKVTLLTRGQREDGLGDRVQRLHADRKNESELTQALNRGLGWDVVFDQICFEAQEARVLCRLLTGKTTRLLFTSSQSVYRFGYQIPESIFDPVKYRFDKDISATEDYSEAKRQCESVFAKADPSLRVAMIRMPLVVGSDDYTGRLLWHIQKCQKGEPMHFPNLAARLCFIRSDMAGQSLLQISQSKHLGPINCSAPGDIRIQDLLALIAKSCGKEWIPEVQPVEQASSPYGLPEDWTMDISKLQALGVRNPALETWLPELITQLVKMNRA